MGPSNRKKPIVLFVSFSILFHLLFLLLITTVMNLEHSSKPPPQAVWIQLPKTKQLPQKIADIAKPVEEKIPEKASAQSLYNQSVPEETVATGIPAKKSPPSQEREEHQPDLKKEQDQKLLALKETRPLIEEKPLPKPEKIPGIPEFESQNGTSADEFFPDYKVGNRTYLNTDANPNIRYFVELRHKFRLTFNPVPSLRGQFNEVARGKIAVVVGVSVNAQGELASLTILRHSGLDPYDREGLRTVRSSAPFSAPPPNLLAEDGLLHMAWTFVVYL